MRVLDVSPRVVVPPMRGSSVRTHNLLRHLSRRHQVRQFAQPRQRDEAGAAASPYRQHVHASRLARTLCAATEHVWVRAPILSGAGLRIGRPALLEELLEWADVALVEFPWQFEYCHRQRPAAPLVLSAHNVEVAKFESWAEAAGARLTRGAWLRGIERAEANAVRKADLIAVVSESDRVELAERYGADPDRVVVVPNGADTEAYRPVDADRRAAAKHELGLPRAPAVIYVGADMPANRAGLHRVRRLAAESDRFTFVVVGTVGGRARVDGNLVVTGHVPDVRPYLEAADLAVCPIEHGGGTKIKLVEGLAAGLPTVAFPPATHGLAVRDGRELLVVPPSEQALLAGLERLADDSVLAERMRGAARRFVVANHDWAHGAGELEAALVRLVGDRPAGPRRAARPQAAVGP